MAYLRNREDLDCKYAIMCIMPLLDLSDVYDQGDFRRLIDRETDRIELKTGVGGRPVQEALVAFSNTEGGVIFIGVNDGREVPGRALDQSTDDRIHRAATDAHNVGRYHVKQIEVAGRPVIAVVVRRREEGIAQTSDGRVLVRRGARNQPVIGDEMWRLASSRTLRRFERAASGVTLDEVERGELESLCEVYGWSPDGAELAVRLRERGLMVDDELTIAGALVLTDPARTLSTSKFVVEIRWFDGRGPQFRRRLAVDGPLPRQVIRVAGLVIDELGNDSVVIGVQRRDLPRLPAVVVREAVANAVAHRSYEQDQTATVIEIRPHELVVQSPGGLPEGVTVATLRQAQAARNPVVIDVLRRYRLTEDAGLGVDVMQDTMRDEMLHPPVFEELGESVRVSLPVLGPVTVQERAWLKDMEEAGRLQPPDRLLLVDAARHDPVGHLELVEGRYRTVGTDTMARRLTNATAREVTGLDREGARAALHRLRDQGFLTQHGQRGGAYYLLARSLARGAAHGMSDEEIDRMVLDAAEQGPVRNQDVRDLTGLDRVRSTAALRRLTTRGLLVQRGARRGTEYVRAPSPGEQ